MIYDWNISRIFVENSFPLKEKSAGKAEDKTVFGLMSRSGPDNSGQESLGP